MFFANPVLNDLHALYKCQSLFNMSLPHYPQVNDLDELFGFSAARRRAEEAAAAAAKNQEVVCYDEPNFIPHRVFLNQVDTFSARHISSFLTDQFYGGQKKSEDEEGGEGEAEAAEMLGEEEEGKEKVDATLRVKYEVIGTLQKSFHKKTEDILFTVNEHDQNFIDTIMKCGYVIYDIRNDPEEIPKALNVLAAIDNQIEKLKELGPKTFKSINEVRVFILISTIMTWAQTKPIDPEDPSLPFTEEDFKKRRPHPNYKDQIDCERDVILIGRKNRTKLKTYVIASGIVYGAEENELTCLFKLAWNNEKELPIFNSGKNSIPLINVKDLAKILFGLMDKTPNNPQYILAVEQTPSTLKQIMKALSKALGSGKVKNVSNEEAFLYNEITQTVFEKCTVNLIMEPGFIVEGLEIEWADESSLAENMKNIVKEFKETRELKPLKIIVHGPPAVGKTLIAKQLSKYYGVHYLNAKSVIDETMMELQDNIDRAKAKIQAQEEKEKALEAGGDDAAGEEAEEEEEEEEDEEAGLEELEEQLNEIRTTMAESENGKLPDEYLNRLMKTFLLSNRCQNQGYVLDGYPKTAAQTKDLFGGGEDAEEAGEEEDDQGGGGGGDNKLLPNFVISLEATDEFVCERVMSLPEKVVQGTHYTEEHMLRRLAEFRANNTEDTTMLNYFNENEIHPLVLNAMEDATETMEDVMQKIKARLPKPITFQLTPEEEEELIRLENERNKLMAKEAQIMKETLQQKAVTEHQDKMEQWTALLEQLQMEEEKMLVAHGEPLRHYLMKYVFPTLSKCLLEVARVKPNDPVDFLAEHLFKENPEGHMFDPAYTRDGKRIMENYQENVEKDITQLALDDV